MKSLLNKLKLNLQYLAYLVIGGVIFVHFGWNTGHLQQRQIDLKNVSASRKNQGNGYTSDVSDTPNTENLTCKFPILNPWDSSIQTYIYHPKDFNCRVVQPYLSFVDSDGNVRLNESEAIRWNISRNLRCEVRPVDRSNGTKDWISRGSPVDLKLNVPVSFYFVDTAEVICYRRRRKIYYNLHNYPITFPKSKFLPSSLDQLSVFIFFLDSVSLSSVNRQLPLTYKFLDEEMGLVAMQGHTKVADNTLVNMMPVLLGKRLRWQQPDMPSEITIPESGQFDEFDFIWKDYAKLGYVTSFIEDFPEYSTFQYLSHGFASKPVHHYAYPFFRLREDSELMKAKSGGLFCCGNEPCVLEHLRILERLLVRYNSTRHLTISFMSELSHDYNSEVERADKFFLAFFQKMFYGGHFANSAMLFMSDHGLRFGRARTTLVGLLEERMPMLGIYFPHLFYEKHPNVLKSLRTNHRRLTSHFDIYVTLLDILNRNYDMKPSNGNKPNRGLSLLSKISTDRTCTQAGIPDIYCVCTEVHPASITEMAVILSGKYLVKHINDKLLWPVRHLCRRLRLHKILRAEYTEPNHKTVTLMRGYSLNSVTSLREKTRAILSIRVLVQVLGSGGHFEATVYYNPTVGDIKVISDVNRVNKYRDQSKCVKDAFLRLYCYCKK